MSAKGTTKFSISHGVLYGINEYAAINPKAHNAQKSASEFFGFNTMMPAPIAPRKSSGASSFTNQVRYIDAGCTCAERPVLVQTANVCSESLMPLLLVRNDE